jgi:phospholipid/cholesterol/gamma-HCH transport system substrate-binding protein
MPNSFDHAGRGPSNIRLFVTGVAFVLVVFVIAALMIAKYKGRLDAIVRVSAELVNVGDGLPAKSDVKFRGVLVGFVSGVVPAEGERPNIVHIDLKPAYAAGIPDTVTARVVPSNVFAVSSVQFVDNGKDTAPLRAGAIIHEDESLPTVLFQTTLNKLRQLLLAFGREPSADSIGWLTALGEATQGRGDRLEGAGRDLNEIVTQLNDVVGDDTGPTTLSAFTAAANGLRNASPELFDALASAVKPMRTLAEKRSALTNLLSGGLGTVGTVGDAFDHHTDRLIAITTQLTPVVGVLADNADAIRRMTGRIMRLVDGFRYVGWNDAAQLPMVKAVISLTPTRTYVRADCPRYGELKGPSCETAPEVPVAPALSSALGSRGLPLPPGVSENRPNLAPPRDSIRGRGEVGDAPLAPDQGTPAPRIAEQPPPLAPEPPSAGLSSPPLPAEIAPRDQPDAPSNPVPPRAVQPQSAVIGGNVGPVGSRQEKDQLSLIVGGDANAATEFLLGPLARGATVHIAPDPGGDR